MDAFFISLAADSKAGAIGVVLSGTGSDGTLGIKAIKNREASRLRRTCLPAHHGMPDSAVAGECVDFVLPPEKISAESFASPIIRTWTVRLTRTGAAATPGAGPEDSFSVILQLLTASSGIDFSHYKQPTVRRRIDRRMLLKRMDSLPGYLECLCRTGELDALYHEMLIQVTSFFRDPEIFETLKLTVFPELLKNRPPDTTIRVWGALRRAKRSIRWRSACWSSCRTSRSRPPSRFSPPTSAS